MALRDILIWPDQILATQATPIDVINADVRQLALDMVETMYAARGIGLAANQIGVLKRLVVVDLNPLPGEEEEDEERNPAYGPHVLINPEITEKIGELTWEEGCLSVPGEVGEVLRAETIEVAYTNLNGEPVVIKASQLMAVCIQHEIDHLNGVCFVDRLNAVKRKLVVREYLRDQELQREDDTIDAIRAIHEEP